MTSAYPGPGLGEPRPAPDPRPASLERILYPEWGPIVAGAISAAALALVLHAFAVAIGLSVSSTAPTWRDASFALVLLSGLYVVLAALASYGLGGYVAGLMRRRSTAAEREDVEFSDGMHGLLVWVSHYAPVLIAQIRRAGVAVPRSFPRSRADRAHPKAKWASWKGQRMPFVVRQSSARVPPAAAPAPEPHWDRPSLEHFR
jgi:hypothetical protein